MNHARLKGSLLYRVLTHAGNDKVVADASTPVAPRQRSAALDYASTENKPLRQ